MQPTKTRILCVSDRGDACETLAASLARRGYEVITAQTLVTALLVACGQAFSLYVLDAEFWGGTGARLCESIREFDPLTPIVLFSSAAGAGALSQAPEADAIHHVFEPDPCGLIEAVHDVASGAVGARAGFASQ